MSTTEHTHERSSSPLHSSELRLETTRLVLRAWESADIPALIDGLNDLHIARWLAVVPHPYTREAAER